MAKACNFLVLTMVLACMGNGFASASYAQETSQETSYSDISRRSLAGAYLGGRLAFGQGDWEEAAKLLTIARKADPDNIPLATSEMTALIQRGRFPDAIKIANDIKKKAPKSGFLPVQLVLACDALSKGKFDKALRALDEISEKGDSQYVIPLIKAWVKIGRGDIAGANAELAKAEMLRGFTPVAQLHKGLILRATKNKLFSPEELIKSAMKAGEQLPPRWLELSAGIFVGSGKKNQAQALIQGIVDKGGGGIQAAVAEDILKAIHRGGTIRGDIKTPVEGVAEALYDLAWLFSRRQLSDDASFLAQLSLALKPKADHVTLVLGDVRWLSKKWEEAASFYKNVPPKSYYYSGARLYLAESLRNAEKSDEAIKVLQDLVKSDPKNVAALSSLGDLLRFEEKYIEAVSAYDAAIKQMSVAGKSEDWQLYYYRATAYERSQQWDMAEKDFLQALKLSPDEPLILNYLAYSWVERGKNLNQAVGMLEKAVELRPEEGFIVDSLGWAYYQQGNFEKAVPLLERAVELTPSDPVLNDHLGDAYWRAGRKKEARFQWRRSLSNDPAQEEISKIEEKLKNGPIEKNGGG